MNEQLKLRPDDWEMFKVFSQLHPIEAYDSRPEDFCEFIREEGYELNDEQIKSIIKETKAEHPDEQDQKRASSNL